MLTKWWPIYGAIGYLKVENLEMLIDMKSTKHLIATIIFIGLGSTIPRRHYIDR